MKVVIFGASGILGQHLRLCVPEGITAVWMRRKADPLHRGLDLTDDIARSQFLTQEKPDVIVNLAGESNTDKVEREPEKYWPINVMLPRELAKWCDANAAHLIQVSTQAVFSGCGAPYSSNSIQDPINCYGLQKAVVEGELAASRQNWTIVRPTFVLGVRPLPFIGRENPVEGMLANNVQRQVGDRWFSVSFARDVAAELWMVACCMVRPVRETVHIGIPFRTSRYELASYLKRGVERVSHDDFPGIAPRPLDTTYAGEGTWRQIQDGLSRCKHDLDDRLALTVRGRARELALFFGLRADECFERLNSGFHPLHAAVTEDFRGCEADYSDGMLLAWYRQTESYIWELSAYHCDAGVPPPGWNYTGMCQGVAERLKAAGARTVLCLGDGIGDLTLSLIRAGFDATYHDLAGSRTAEFAQFRAWMYLGKRMPALMSQGWEPRFPARHYDAVVSLDFLEHVTDVPMWTRAIKHTLQTGGLFLAQNAFGIGSESDGGSMPMHLTRNDRFETDWTPLLAELGFAQEGLSNWWRAPSVPAAGVVALPRAAA